MSTESEYLRWLSSDKVSDEMKDELRSLSEDDIKLRFHGYLQFGTAGLRGTTNAGTNAMNIHTVAHATQGLASLIVSENRCADGAVIAYDSRHNSELFAKTAAQVFAANGIKAYIFDSLRPTPVLSFAVRYLHCAAGVNITASHNPKQYNGYKAYWDDGAQLSPAQAKTVSACIGATDIFNGIRSVPFNDGIKSGMISIIGIEVDEAYLSCVSEQLLDRDVISRAKDFSIVYTPLNGAGYKMVPEILRRAGIKNLAVVPEQSEPDGDFPTTPFPNPEYKDVFTPGIRLADEIGSDLIIATDPDADRMGIAVRESDGKFVTMTGNQVGALLLDYIITALKNTGRLPARPYAVKSFVSTELAAKIASDNGVDMYNVFTGFKYIGETITEQEDSSNGRCFLLGFEESYGYLRGTYARDKDAVVASLLISEAAAYYKSLGMTLCDAMRGLYEKYGHYVDGVDSVYMEGLDGLEKMKSLMSALRKNPPETLAGYTVDSYIDYSIPALYDMKTGTKTPMTGGTTDTLYYRLGTDVVVIRPSGTEPKIKFYYLLNGKNASEAAEKLERYRGVAKELIH